MALTTSAAFAGLRSTCDLPAYALLKRPVTGCRGVAAVHVQLCCATVKEPSALRAERTTRCITARRSLARRVAKNSNGLRATSRRTTRERYFSVPLRVSPPKLKRSAGIAAARSKSNATATGLSSVHADARTPRQFTAIPMDRFTIASQRTGVTRRNANGAQHQASGSSGPTLMVNTTSTNAIRGQRYAYRATASMT